MFVNRLSERLIQQEAIGGALTEAARLAGLAAERLAAGDVTGFRQFAGQARTAFLQGQSVALKTFGTIVPEANTFLSSIGTFPSGTGIINPSGIGLPSLATTSMTQVPGPLGKPTLAIVHGGETVTARVGAKWCRRFGNWPRCSPANGRRSRSMWMASGWCGSSPSARIGGADQPRPAGADWSLVDAASA